jgi:hypothetical protein
MVSASKTILYSILVSFPNFFFKKVVLASEHFGKGNLRKSNT